MRNYFCVESSFIRTQKFLNLHDSAALLYFEFLSFGDDYGFVENPAAIMNMFKREKKDYDELIAANFILDITLPNGNDGLLIITDFKRHNPNLKFRNSKYRELYPKISQKLLNTTLTDEKKEEEEGEVKSNKVKSQNLNIITSAKDLNSECEKLATKSANKTFEDLFDAIMYFRPEYCEKNIIEGFNRLQFMKNQIKIKDEVKYLSTILKNLQRERAKNGK